LLTWVIGLGIVLLGLAVAGYIYRGHVLSALDIIADETGGRTMAALAVLGALLLLIWLLVWLLFPLMVIWGLRDLRRRTAELEQTSRLCVRHLAQLTAPPKPAQNQPPTQQKPVSTNPDSGGVA
jgi:hypothetical protein